MLDRFTACQLRIVHGPVAHALTTRGVAPKGLAGRLVSAAATGFCVLAYRSRRVEAMSPSAWLLSRKARALVRAGAVGVAARPTGTGQQGDRRLAHDTGALEDEAGRHACVGPMGRAKWVQVTPRLSRPRQFSLYAHTASGRPAQAHSGAHAVHQNKGRLATPDKELVGPRCQPIDLTEHIMKHYDNGRQLVEAGQQAEVIWYRARGRYPKRIAKDAFGCSYVIGDDAWNFGLQPKDREVVEPVMRIYCASGANDR